MKSLIIAGILAVTSTSVLADNSIASNPDLYSGHGSGLVSNVSGNYNSNADLYGNGYGESVTDSLFNATASIDFNDITADTANHDLYGGI